MRFVILRKKLRIEVHLILQIFKDTNFERSALESLIFFSIALIKETILSITFVTTRNTTL